MRRASPAARPSRASASRARAAGGCTFKLPKTAKGKQLVVTVTATPAGGKAQTFPAYKFRVR